MYSRFVALTGRAGSVPALALGLLGRREAENATNQGLERGCARGYDTDVYLEKPPELNVVCAAPTSVAIRTDASMQV
jgi:hypothetical protein